MWIRSAMAGHAVERSVDGMLPFGLRSAPKIFNALADALEWIVFQAWVQHIFHYLDDFAVIGSPGSGECQNALARTLAPEKKMVRVRA